MAEEDCDSKIDSKTADRDSTSPRPSTVVPGPEPTLEDEADEVALAGTTPKPASGPKFRVIVGTSAVATGSFCKLVSSMVCKSYGYQRLSPGEVESRLGMGDAGEQANRVLHLAWRVEGDEETLVGCCSSTKQTPWCPRGCGHWGLLVVAVEAQGTGVASALVRAAEGRLRRAGLSQVQIEYEYTCGDAQSERLFAWYEGGLGFSGGSAPTGRTGHTEFRRCRKRLPRQPPEEEDAAMGDDGRACSKTAVSMQSGDAQPATRCWARLLRLYRSLFA